MNKKGFTLIELLAVLVLIIIITTIGTYSVIAVQRQIKEDLWNSKVELIEQKAKTYGEDNKFLLEGKSKDDCYKVTVQTLLDKNYLSTKEEDKDGNKVITNDTKDIDDSGYYVNDMNVCIYEESNMVYAELIK